MSPAEGCDTRHSRRSKLSGGPQDNTYRNKVIYMKQHLQNKVKKKLSSMSFNIERKRKASKRYLFRCVAGGGSCVVQIFVLELLMTGIILRRVKSHL